MKRVQAEQLLSRITYKPGWKLRIEEHAASMTTTLCVEFEAADATRRHYGAITIHGRETLPPLEFLTSERDFLKALQGALLRIERHEVDEWLQIDGRAPFYPHLEQP